MHELSLALEVCRLAESHVPPDRVATLRTVAIEIGEESNVEIENFRFCLETLLGAPPFGGAHPAFIPRPGTDLRIAWLEVDDDSPAH
jgi:Zn finger protein HypA/HybF involved in hydrogenase expression